MHLIAAAEITPSGVPPIPHSRSTEEFSLTASNAADTSKSGQLDTAGLARSGELLPAAASNGEPGRVVNWMADRTEPTGDTSATTINELYADYEVWCFGKRLRAIAVDDFANEFDRVREVPQLAGKIRKFGSRYYGIRLVNSNVARLSARRK